MKLTEKTIVAALRRNGYKATPQRRAVIRAIANSIDHLTPADIYDRIHLDHPGIGLVTVYRTLEVLATLNLVCELHTGTNCPSYTLSIPQHHHHLVCSDCGKVVDFTGHNLTELEERLTRESGFRINNHILEFTGCCRTCQEMPGTASAAR